MKRQAFGFALLVVLFAAVLFVPTLWAQAQAGDLATATPPGSPTDEWGASVVWAFISSSALEWLKRNQKLTAFSERTAWGIQRGVGWALALAAALGVHASFTYTPDGTLTAVFTGLVWSSAWEAGKETLRQWVFQEITYRTAVKNYRRGEMTA
jgi:hypothetical protein